MQTEQLRHIEHKFSSEEMAQIAKDITDHLGRKDELEERLKSIKADYKAQAEQLDAELRNLTRKHRSGYEMREVRCDIVRDVDRGIVQFVRQDTKEIVSERPMTSEERQLTFGDLDPDTAEAAQDAMAVHSGSEGTEECA